MTFLNVTFSAFFFYLLLIYLKLVGCLPSACFLIWSPGLDCSREENFSSLKLSIKMRHFLSPSPRPHFGPFGSLSLPALLYLVLVLVLSPHLPPSTKESSILWSYFAFFLLTLEVTNTCKIYFCRCMFHMCAILYMIIKLIICHSSALACCSLTCTNFICSSHVFIQGVKIYHIYSYLSLKSNRAFYHTESECKFYRKALEIIKCFSNYILNPQYATKNPIWHYI